jgi:hypothetical protein
MVTTSTPLCSIDICKIFDFHSTERKDCCFFIVAIVVGAADAAVAAPAAIIQPYNDGANLTCIATGPLYISQNARIRDWY